MFKLEKSVFYDKDKDLNADHFFELYGKNYSSLTAFCAQYNIDYAYFLELKKQHGATKALEIFREEGRVSEEVYNAIKEDI